MSIEIRPARTYDDCLAAEALQKAVWGLPDVDVVPGHLLITAAKNGGLLLLAFDHAQAGNLESAQGADVGGARPEPAQGSRPVGFVFGFLGLTPTGRLKHCSHMAGVLPAYRDRSVGYRLKLAQREHVLAQGIELITWTFDPLEARNASLNFRKLGAVCRTYLVNLYGEMRDALNVGLPSDRFEVAWWIAGRRVVDRLAGADPSPVDLPDAALPTQGAWPAPPESALAAGQDRLWVPIPADFQALKAADAALAWRWRLFTRRVFQEAFAGGYTVVDFVRRGALGYYLLAREKLSR
ncbi:MAG: hypothetical protein NZ528_10875 [Caldilineales bacterium]|nr:hypothetical protein [Caldilineales bacterium]MDW8316796.1 hypothetical protein [Anaerolineae bacterium]